MCSPANCPTRSMAVLPNWQSAVACQNPSSCARPSRQKSRRKQRLRAAPRICSKHSATASAPSRRASATSPAIKNTSAVSAEEAVQLLHFARGVVRLVDRFEPWQLRLDETRERFDRRRNGQLIAGLLARDEFIERGAHVGFFEHTLDELREEHRHPFGTLRALSLSKRLAELVIDPAARERRTMAARATRLWLEALSVQRVRPCGGRRCRSCRIRRNAR